MPSWGDILEQIRQGTDEIGAESYDVVRKHYLNKVAQETDSDAILYASSWTVPSNSQEDVSLSDADVQGFMEALSGRRSDTLSLILHSPGGKPEAAEHIVEYLRSMYDEIDVYVPHAARSAATLMCCSADSVVMGKHSSLGPIDPQFTIRTGLGVRMVPADSIIDQFDKAREEFAESGTVGAWGPMLQQYGPSLIKECEDAKDYSKNLAKKWSKEYMFEGSNASQQASELSEALIEREEHKSHSRPIMRDEAEEMGFNVKKLEENQDLQDAVLSTYHAASHTFSGTSAIKIIESHNQSSYVVMSDDNESDDDDE